jgi:enoyl-CoA hydratase
MLFLARTGTRVARRSVQHARTVTTLQTGADDVALLTFDDGKMNSFTFEAIESWNTALDEAEGAGALVIGGNEKAFSAGFDLGVMKTIPSEEAGELVRKGAELTLRVASYPRPVVMAATGHSLALGAIMLFAGDYRIGTDNPKSKFGMNEVHLGMPLPAFAMELARWRLSNLYFTRSTTLGTVYGSSDAQAAGYLDEVVPHDMVMERAAEYAATVSGIATKPLVKTKQIERDVMLRLCRDQLDGDVALFAKGL